MKLPLLFGIHCHQPVGNFDHVVDEATEKCYLPFFKEAVKFPQFKFSVHYSGWLLEFIKERHPELFTLMKKCCEQKQIEFFTGGYYEPVLSSIPSIDRRGQIKKLNKFIYDNFGQTPRGLWLTERVWDPAIIPDIVECGVDYIIVDDYHFTSAGYYKEMLHGYYMTEQDGCPLKIFPIDKELRYLTPFKPVKDVVKYLHKVKEGGGKAAVIFDDGEKFGVWPKTYEWVYEEGWLEDFINGVIEDKQVEFEHYGNIAEKQRPAGLAYLPITSYYEMGEWALFSERTTEMEKLQTYLKTTEFKDVTDIFVKGGIWKNFFTKYPESNMIHKRALRLSKYLSEFPEDEILKDAVYKAECNDVLWHGIFGGLYLPNLRNNSWRFIIEAEKRYEQLKGIIFPDIEKKDITFNGFDDVYVRTKNYNAMFTSRDNGQMSCLELKDDLFNYQNTLSRRKEAYHQKFLEEPKETEKIDDEGISTIHDIEIEGLEEIREQLAVDWYNRNSFVDHFTQNFYLPDFEKSSFLELGDFANTSSTFEINKNNIVSTREGGIYVNGDKFSTEVIKTYTFTEKSINFTIEIETGFNAELTYVCEFNFHFADLAGLKINGKDMPDRLEIKSGNIELFDPARNRSLKINSSNSISYAYRVRSVSQSEKGVDLTEQAVCCMLPVKFSGRLKFSGSIEI